MRHTLFIIGFSLIVRLTEGIRVSPLHFSDTMLVLFPTGKDVPASLYGKLAESPAGTPSLFSFNA